MRRLVTDRADHRQPDKSSTPPDCALSVTITVAGGMPVAMYDRRASVAGQPAIPARRRCAFQGILCRRSVSSIWQRRPRLPLEEQVNLPPQALASPTWSGNCRLRPGQIWLPVTSVVMASVNSRCRSRVRRVRSQQIRRIAEIPSSNRSRVSSAACAAGRLTPPSAKQPADVQERPHVFGGGASITIAVESSAWLNARPGGGNWRRRRLQAMVSIDDHPERHVADLGVSHERWSAMCGECRFVAWKLRYWRPLPAAGGVVAMRRAGAWIWSAEILQACQPATGLNPSVFAIRLFL